MSAVEEGGGGRESDSRREAYLKEYEAVMSLMRDTGDSIWVINGAYMVAVTVLIATVAAALDKQAWLATLGSLVGLYVCCLWLRSFKHNYRYYVLRIDYGRWLEKRLGFLILRMGALLDEKGGPPPQGENPFAYFNDRTQRSIDADTLESERLKRPGRRSIQKLTTRLIWTFMGMFFILLLVGGARWVCPHHHRHFWHHPPYELVTHRRWRAQR